MTHKPINLYLSGSGEDPPWRSLVAESLRDIAHYTITPVEPQGDTGAEFFALCCADSCLIYLAPGVVNDRALMDLAYCVSLGKRTYLVCPHTHPHKALLNIMFDGLETVHLFDSLDHIISALKLASGAWWHD